MKKFAQMLAFACFLLSVVLGGVFGLRTEMESIWPVWSILGAAGFLSVLTIFCDTSFRVSRAILIALFALVIYLLVRASESPVVYFGRSDTALIVGGFVAFVIAVTVFTKASMRLKLIAIWSILLLAHGCLALVQELAPTWGVLAWLQNWPGAAMGAGLFESEAHLGALVAALIPIWVSLLIFGRVKARTRFVLAALTVTMVVSIGLIGNYPAALSAAIGLSVIFGTTALVFRKRFAAPLRIVGGIAITAALLGLSSLVWLKPEFAKRHIAEGLLLKDGEMSLPSVWSAHWQQVAESPIIGTGARTSILFGRRFRSPDLAESVAEPKFAHNEFLQLTADYGILGLSLALVVGGMLLLNGWRFIAAYRDFTPPKGRRLPASDHLAIAIGSLGAFSAIGTMACFDYVLHLPVFVMMVASLGGFLAVPDPMAAASQAPKVVAIPGGGLLFAGRALGFGCGIALLCFGFVFSRSEYHFREAQRAHQDGKVDFQVFRHLKAARDLDPSNPFVRILSAEVELESVRSGMPELARQDALERAESHYAAAQRLYPENVESAIGHAKVLMQLGRISAARERIADAREWAPLYGSLMIAEAQQAFREGDLSLALLRYEEALNAPAFRDTEAARQGLLSIDQWRQIAGGNTSPPDPDDAGARLPEAKVDERRVAGRGGEVKGKS
ncbi:MAG: O-antigen ligase family protein [Verrucomicrobiota bacterium]